MIRVGEVLVAYARVSGLSADVNAEWISEPERERLTRIRGRDAEIRSARFVEGRRLLRELVSQIDPDADPAIVSRCETCGSGAHGAPRSAAGVAHVSVSYSGNVVMVAAAPTASMTALGLDVEAGEPGERLQDVAALFAPSEPPTRREWTAIEATVKADGRGLNISPETIAVTATLARVPGADAPFELSDARAPRGYTATLALTRRV